MRLTLHKACAASGIACVILFVLGFWVFAGFIPTHSPQDGPEAVARLYRENLGGIRLGMVVSMYASVLLGPWAAAIAMQIRRIDAGRDWLLASIELMMGGLLVLEFIYLIMFWLTAAFRPDRAPEVLQALDDLAWIPFVGLGATAVLQASVIAVAVLRDPRECPLMPRWVGYFNIWAAVLFVPGSLNVFFKSGPLAWNGIIAWYLPLATAGAWLIVNSVAVWRAFDRQERVDRDRPTEPSVESLAAEIAELRAEMAATSGMHPSPSPVDTR